MEIGERITTVAGVGGGGSDGGDRVLDDDYDRILDGIFDGHS